MEIRAGTKWLDPSSLNRDNKDDDVVICGKCGCKWMELILVQQYNKHFHVVLGQKPMPKTDLAFWLFRCPKCNEVWEPPVQVGAYDSARKGYDQFVNHMLQPVDDPNKPQGEKI